MFCTTVVPAPKGHLGGPATKHFYMIHRGGRTALIAGCMPSHIHKPTSNVHEPTSNIHGPIFNINLYIHGPIFGVLGPIFHFHKPQKAIYNIHEPISHTHDPKFDMHKLQLLVPFAACAGVHVCSHVYGLPCHGSGAGTHSGGEYMVNYITKLRHYYNLLLPTLGVSLSRLGSGARTHSGREYI